MSASYVVNTQCAVVRNGRYLTIVRGERVKHAPGELGFPGGKVEVADGPDRILESAVRREVLEETGVTVSAELRYVRSVAFTMRDGTGWWMSCSSASTWPARRISRRRTR